MENESEKGKPMSEWTLEDCDSKEYWKTLFEWGSHFKLKALDNDFYPSWENSELLLWVKGNRILANRMLTDLINHHYLLGYVKKSNVVFAQPLWFNKGITIVEPHLSEKELEQKNDSPNL